MSHVAAHYSRSRGLADAIAAKLRDAGIDLEHLETGDLAAVDEFHIGGRAATLELAEQMKLDARSRVLDIGSGLGGPARTLAETYGCHVTGVDLTEGFCEAAAALSKWVGLSGHVAFKQGDATDLPFDDNAFDAAMTIHAAMNIAAKDAMYAEARRVLRPGGIFAIYDVLQGEGGEVLLPAPWARGAVSSHPATPDEMRSLLKDAGFEILHERDSSEEDGRWFAQMVARAAEAGPPPVSFQLFLGDDFPEMARNQVRNLAERRIRTLSYICRA